MQKYRKLTVKFRISQQSVCLLKLTLAQHVLIYIEYNIVFCVSFDGVIQKNRRRTSLPAFLTSHMTVSRNKLNLVFFMQCYHVHLVINIIFNITY